MRVSSKTHHGKHDPIYPVALAILHYVRSSGLLNIEAKESEDEQDGLTR
jgi:hypothetical protein